LPLDLGPAYGRKRRNLSFHDGFGEGQLTIPKTGRCRSQDLCTAGLPLPTLADLPG